MCIRDRYPRASNVLRIPPFGKEEASGSCCTSSLPVNSSIIPPLPSCSTKASCFSAVPSVSGATVSYTHLRTGSLNSGIFENASYEANGNELVIPLFGDAHYVYGYTGAQRPMLNTGNASTPLTDIYTCLLYTSEIAPKIRENQHDYQLMADFMLSATMALNGFIAMGVSQDWATHMIGHEITALHGLTHGHTLAIVLPATLQVLHEEKGDKLLQYGERVWGITSGTREERIDEAVSYTHLDVYKRPTLRPVCFQLHAYRIL